MSADSQAMEHRWGTRFRINYPVVLKKPSGEQIAARVRDASLSGAFIETGQQPALLSRAWIKPVGQPGEWLEGCVVRRTSKGVAIEWLDPELRAVSALMALRRERPLPDNPIRTGAMRRYVESSQHLT